MTPEPEQQELPPETLYHYCSASAFLAIIRSRTIRLGSIFFMNDSKEYYWFQEQVLQYIQQHRDESPEYFAEVEAHVSQPSIDQYCACFSADGDSLSQWRAYADDGRGFAIGFNPKHFLAFDTRAAVTLGKAILRKVIYEEPEQQALIRRALISWNYRRRQRRGTRKTLMQ